MVKLSATVSLIALLASAGTAFAGADLVPVVSQLENGTIGVTNTGDAASGPSYVAVECNKLPGNGGCPEAPGMAAYDNPQFPSIAQGHAVVAVPALQPGQTFQHQFSFFDDLNWVSGSTYQLIAHVDPGSAIAEDNERNNNASVNFQKNKTATGGGNGAAGGFVAQQPSGSGSTRAQLGGQGGAGDIVTPGQAEIMVTPLGFVIVNLIKWGQSITLDHPTSVTATQQGIQKNLCKMSQAAHRTYNSGPVGTGNFKTRYYRDGVLVHTQTLNLPAKSGVDWQHFDLYLREGWNTVEVRLDADSQVPESDEANNKQFVKVNLQIDCDGDGRIAGGPIVKTPIVPAQPGAGTPKRVAPVPTQPDPPPSRTLKLAPAN